MIRFLLLFLLAVRAAAQDVNVTLTWDANAEPDLAGYCVYWGSASGAYTQSAEVTTNRATIALPRSQMAYIAVTAINTGEAESAFSKELIYFAKAPGEIRIPNPPQNVRAPKELNSARVEKSTDLKHWVPIYWTANPAELFRVVYTLN